MRSGRDGRAPSGERRADAVRRTHPRRTRGARSRLRGDEATHGVSRMRAAGADARRTGARPKTARKREGATRRTRPGIANAARFGAAAGRTACRTWRVGQDCGLRLTLRSPHGRQDAQVARPEAGAPLPRSAPHVGKRQDTRDGPRVRATFRSSSAHATSAAIRTGRASAWPHRERRPPSPDAGRASSAASQDSRASRP